MATISVKLSQDQLILSQTGLGDLTLALTHQIKTSHLAIVWRDQVEVLDEGQAAADWLTQALGLYRGEQLRLVRFADNAKRPVDGDFLPQFGSGFDANTGLSDGFPYLVANQASLHDLNQTLRQKGAGEVDMARFRANILVSELPAWQEFEITTVNEVNQFYQLSFRKPCQRCPITKIDQKTGQIIDAKEPLTSLTQLNPLPDLKGAYFGQNAILTLGEGQVIQVGDRLKAIDSTPNQNRR